MESRYTDLLHGLLGDIIELNCDNCEVYSIIGALDGCIDRGTVDEGNGKLLGVLDDVVVGDDQQFIIGLIKDNTRTGCRYLILLQISTAVEVIKQAAVALLLDDHGIGDADDLRHRVLYDVGDIETKPCRALVGLRDVLLCGGCCSFRLRSGLLTGNRGLTLQGLVLLTGNACGCGDHPAAGKCVDTQHGAAGNSAEQYC